MSAAYDIYMRLLFQLHGLIAAGKGESEQADSVRNQMDEPHRLLPEHDEEAARVLSEQLYRVAEMRPGVKVYAECKGMDVAGRFVSVDWATGKAQVDFGGCDGVLATPLETVDLYDLT